MADLAFNEYSWKNSEHTIRVTNNIVPDALQNFYDVLKLHGHFATDPVFASNSYTKSLYDKNVRIPVRNKKVDTVTGVRPTISLSNVPRRYLDFWSGAQNWYDNNLYPAVGTDITISEMNPRLLPHLNTVQTALGFIQYNKTYGSNTNRAGKFWEITLKASNVYPFGWYARLIGYESDFINEFGDLLWCDKYEIYSGNSGTEQSLLYSFIRDINGNVKTSGIFTDTFMPVKLQKTGGAYDDIYIPYMRSITSLTMMKDIQSQHDLSRTGWLFRNAQYSLADDVHFIFCSNADSNIADFVNNPWASGYGSGAHALNEMPYWDSSAGVAAGFIIATKSAWEKIFTGSGMPWTYDIMVIKSPDDGGLNKPDESGLPDNPADDTPGTGDNTSDIVEYPTPLYIPNATVYDRYFLTPNQVPDVKKFLFSDTFVDNIKRLWTNPAEYVISFVCYPFDVASTGLTTTNGVVSIGGVSSNIAAAALTDRGVPYFYGGSVYVDKYYNSYLDYEPYTSIDIYIPYIGVRPLNVSQVVGHTLCIGYYIDLNTQQITALIGLDGDAGNLGQVVTQFVGSIGIQTPLSGTSSQDMIRNIVAQTSGLITGVGAIAGGVMGANPALLASGVASTSNALLGGGHTAPSYYGSLSPVSGLYTPQVAYLIINRPRQAMPAAYLTQQGFSSNYSGKVSQFSGYLECASVNIASTTTMTEQEQQEIINLLTGGIYCG